ncbi:MAG: hypothetical protein ACP5N1_02530 [Candidatus Woesearchaeota archaeon]
MLDSKLIKKICDFVYVKPRSIQEISFHIQKNWRTADSYVEKIIKEQGNLAIRTFREGSRGALKIVYWNNIEKIHSNDFQERLFKKIETARNKSDFSPFDIYQYVSEDKRHAFLEEQSEYTVTSKQDLVSAMNDSEKQLLIFSGNLSWVNAMQDKKKIIDVFEELNDRNISIKVLCQITPESLKNVKKLLEIAEKRGRKNIEIRHCEQPFRAFIVDDKLVRFKESRKLDTEKTEKNNINKKSYIFYEINDTEWIEWMQKVFWNLFRTSIDAKTRIKDIESIEKIR